MSGACEADGTAAPQTASKKARSPDKTRAAKRKVSEQWCAAGDIRTAVVLKATKNEARAEKVIKATDVQRAPAAQNPIGRKGESRKRQQPRRRRTRRDADDGTQLPTPVFAAKPRHVAALPPPHPRVHLAEPSVAHAAGRQFDAAGMLNRAVQPFGALARCLLLSRCSRQTRSGAPQ